MHNFRCHDDLELPKFTSEREGHWINKLAFRISEKVGHEVRSRKAEKDELGRAFHGKVLSRVFSEDYEVVEKLILDPRGPIVNRWNKVFLVACLISLFVDPLFFYLPMAKANMCMDICVTLEVVLTVIRSLVDSFYVIQIFVRFKTAYVAPSSRVFGRGELVVDPSKVASRYFHKDFWLDLVAAQPLPQVCH